MKKTLFCFVVMLAVSINTSIVFAADKSDKICLALETDARVNEILDNVIGTEVKDSDTINYIEAAVCINQVIGLSDNGVSHPLIHAAYDFDISLWSSKEFCRRYFIGDYLNTMGYATVFPPLHNKKIDCQRPEELFYREWYYDMVDICTKKNALELAVNCIYSDCEDYIETSKELGLYYDVGLYDDASNYDDLITVAELKKMMSDMYKIKGELYYSSDLDSGIFERVSSSSGKMSYYERYCKRLTFDPNQIDINGRKVSVMENEFGAKLIGFRDLCDAYGISLEWDNGIITFTYDGEIHELHLDNFANHTKMLVDKSVYEWHPVPRNDMFVDLDKSFTYFGQYEMINDSVYIYPKTLSKFTNYVGIDTELTYESLIGTEDDDIIVLEKDFDRMSDREQIALIATEHGPVFVRPSGSPVYVSP